MQHPAKHNSRGVLQSLLSLQQMSSDAQQPPPEASGQQAWIAAQQPRKRPPVSGPQQVPSASPAASQGVPACAGWHFPFLHLFLPFFFLHLPFWQRWQIPQAGLQLVN